MARCSKKLDAPVVNNNEVIVERSRPMNETLSDKHKTDDNYYSHNDVATWPEVLTHNMRVR